VTFDLPALYQITEPVDHAECPIWDPRTNLLYYTDIHSVTISKRKKTRFIQLEGEVAPVILSKNNSSLLVVGLNRAVVAIEWDGKGQLNSQRVLTRVQPKQTGSRMNDGKADKEGRLWIGENQFTLIIHEHEASCRQEGQVGSMGHETQDGTLTANGGALFKITKENIADPTPIFMPVNISNGLAWNKANDKFYYIDTPTQEIAEYDYSNQKGEVTNRRVVFDLKQNGLNCHPDGMTIDKDDNLWIALYGGGSVIKVNPSTGKLLQRVAIPAESVTSATWGGTNLDILFVTTSRYSLNNAQREKQPAAGSVFAVKNLGTGGLPVFYADII
ncbi:hypothetical protein NQ317_009744, partial [Molorchus minor]